MKKKLYLVLVPKQTDYQRTNGMVKDFSVEGIYQKIPNSKPGLTIELDLEIDEAMFLPIVPNARIKIEMDKQADEAMTVVTGKRVKSPHAPTIT